MSDDVNYNNIDDNYWRSKFDPEFSDDDDKKEFEEKSKDLKKEKEELEARLEDGIRNLHGLSSEEVKREVIATYKEIYLSLHCTQMEKFGMIPDYSDLYILFGWVDTLTGKS